MPTKKKFAFTLAEVLITLGIIGVVAAMTIPTLITNNQKRVAVTKLQRVIAELNQVYRLSINEQGNPGPDQINQMGSEKYFKQYWLPYMKVAHYCKTYQECGLKNTCYYKRPDSDSCVIRFTFDENLGFSIMTFQGMIYSIRTAQGVNIDNASLILVDINGAKQPNVIGKDVFALTRDDNQENGSVFPFGYDRTDEEIDANCISGRALSANGDKQYTHPFFACAEKIRRAGWKIDNSYPW